MKLAGLFLYPVKSLRGFAVASADLDPLGLVGDRRFLVVAASAPHATFTQRTHPRMALIATHLTPDRLTLSADGAGAVSVPRASDPAAPLLTVAVWSSPPLLAEDCGEGVAGWLSAFLGAPCRLVRAGEKFRRPVGDLGDTVSFADAYPLLIVSEASLADLNDHILEQAGEPVPMDRFRPNLVIAGCPPFAEDTWPRLRIGDVTFRAGGPCSRCVMTTTDQFTGVRGKEPLRTLATYRRDAQRPTDVNFGQNLINESKTGAIQVGDVVIPL